jgi:thiol-disulfide isomerase/thioredoxin
MSTMPTFEQAPALQTSGWINAPDDFSLETVKGKVVLIEAFQMLCPGCVSHGLPQAQRVANLFDDKDVAVIGLHTVFEHHAAQGHRAALEAFVHEYRFTFPIGIDMHDVNGIPQTMQAYRLQGTPTLILLDRLGQRRMQSFGRMEDLQLGASIMSLINGATRPLAKQSRAATSETKCDADGCAI